MASMPHLLRRLASAILLVAVAGIWGCSDSGPVEPPAIVVFVAESERRDVPLSIEMVGSTLGNQDVPIRARVEGFLDSMDFQEGQNVEKGELLYAIDPQPFKAKVVEAQSALAAAETNLVKSQADLGRIRPLAEIDAVSQQDLDSAVAEEAAGQASVRAAEAGVELAEIELGYTKIYAPIDGLIGLTKAKPGEFVGREPNPVVLNTLSDIDPIRVRFSISEREYLILARTHMKAGRTRDGDAKQASERNQDELDRRELTLILADGSEWDKPGFANATAQSIDASTGTFSVEAVFPNPDGLLLPGQFARVRAPYDTLKDVVVVPKQAIVELQGRFRVYVVDADNVVKIVDVETGPTTGNDIVIKAGLEAGQSVIVEGVQKVRPDMKVAPQPFTRTPQPALISET
jgi:membrane fusion protein (multidrug efflux system)